VKLRPTLWPAEMSVLCWRGSRPTGHRQYRGAQLRLAAAGAHGIRSATLERVVPETIGAEEVTL
jgi:hypothetical protein